MTKKLLIPFLILLPFSAFAAPGLPDNAEIDDSVPTPAEVLGFEPGERHPRHDQIVTYLRRLAEHSDRVKLEEIGQSHGGRPQVLLTFARPERLAEIDDIRSGRQEAARNGEGPPVVWMGYSVHGNEASGASAALVMAWYLAAGQDERVTRWLDEMIMVMEPAINPDGIDRFAHWVNMHRGNHPSPDSDDREHQEGWPDGRTNYYWFDLNRDWLPVVHPVSQNRLRHYHLWRPHVITDHHEMGNNSTFFFQPGIPERANPLISEANQELTGEIAEFHGMVLDGAAEPFYARESFDDFYIGKGSTYPDVTGGIGILFEQASSRGAVQESDYGVRRFAETVANQVRTSVSTLDGALAHADELVGYQRDFLDDTRDQADDWGRAGWLLGDGGDPVRAHALVGMLLNHDVAVHPVDDTVEIGEARFEPGSAWAIPADQDAYLLLKSVFEAVTEMDVETFYDVSAWPMAMAHDLPLATTRRLPSVGEALAEAPVHDPAAVQTSALAWLVSWNQYRADALLADLLDDGYRVQAATEQLTVKTAEGERDFERGSLVIHRGIQPDELDPVGDRLAELSTEHGVDVIAARQGMALSGVDLGSPSVPVLEPVSAALLTGSGVSAYAAGAVWHWFDTRLAEPVAQLDVNRLRGGDLEEHTHLIVPPGWYGSLSDSVKSTIVDFVRGGGTLVAFGEAAEMAESLELGWDLVEENDEEEEAGPERKPYGDYRQDRARELIGGTALRVDIDRTHPLAWGYADDELVLFRQGAHRLKAVDNDYAQVGIYTDDPLAAGYLSEKNREELAGTPAVSVSRHGAGTVVRIADEPLFRGYWRGGEKLFANALFFSQLVSPTRLPDEE
ncbi:M14 family zinc carboxypeptidase [Wenzhouxiangella sp. EGI_FJ10305]|uniref:M14 family zinc carboxypeptidase n=1 Tax=Wenzhouxiangella sp. EGI_FJ10305 TaxID=3243768 RepID=UPI0035D9CE3C